MQGWIIINEQKKTTTLTAHEPLFLDVMSVQMTLRSNMLAQKPCQTSNWYNCHCLQGRSTTV